MTDEHLSAAIHGERIPEDGAPVALNRSGPSPAPGRTPPAEGGGLASALIHVAFAALFIAGVFVWGWPREAGEPAVEADTSAPVARRGVVWFGER